MEHTTHIRRIVILAFLLAFVFLSSTAVIVEFAIPGEASAQAGECTTTNAPSGAYSVTVCLVEPTDGSIVSGVVNVTATVSTTGSSPGVSKPIFYLDGDYLLMDFKSPYTFELPSATFVDAARTLSVRVTMRDGVITQPTSVNLLFRNNVTEPPINNNAFMPSPASGQPLVVAATGDGASGEWPQVSAGASTGSVPSFQFPTPLLDYFGVVNSASQRSTPQNPYTSYVRVTDALEMVSVRVPYEWSDVETGPWLIGGHGVGVYIAAAPDLHSYYGSAGRSGVFFGVSRELAGTNRVANPAQTVNPAILQLLIDEKGWRQGRCRDAGRFAYQDNFYQGQYDLYLNCIPENHGEIVLVTMPAHQEFISLLRISIASEADLDAATHILNTFQVTTAG